MIFFAKYGNTTYEETCIFEASSKEKVLQWLKDFTNISGDEEDYQDGTIIGETYYQIEVFDNTNEEHRDAMTNIGVPLIID